MRVCLRRVGAFVVGLFVLAATIHSSVSLACPMKMADDCCCCKRGLDVVRGEAKECCLLKGADATPLPPALRTASTVAHLDVAVAMLVQPSFHVTAVSARTFIAHAQAPPGLPLFRTLQTIRC